MTKTLLRQNGELRADHIWNWSIPAFVTTLDDGRSVNVCPQAGACAKLCYATTGTYKFPVVLASHQRNLVLTMDTPDVFVEEMNRELTARRFRPKGVPRIIDGLDSRDHLSEAVRGLLDTGAAVVRIHDTGDFYSQTYLDAWVSIARANPGILFYAYTKSVTLVRGVVLPANMLVCYSMGGKEDHLIDVDRDQHAEVFPDVDAIESAGYFDQSPNDLLCVLAPTTKVGIPANGIKHFQKRQGARTFGEIEAGLTRHGRVNLLEDNPPIGRDDAPPPGIEDAR